MATLLSQIRKKLEMDATPIDFAKLEAEGLLRKVGAWYEVPDLKKLPQHVRTKGVKLKPGKDKRILVQFSKRDPAVAKRLLERFKAQHPEVF